jgi:hypothetical protein
MRMQEIYAIRRKIFGHTFDRSMPLAINRTGDLQASIVLLEATSYERPAGLEWLRFDGGTVIPAGVISWTGLIGRSLSVEGHAAKILAITKQPARLAAAVQCTKAAALDYLTGQSLSVRVSCQARRYTFNAGAYELDSFSISNIEIINTNK